MIDLDEEPPDPEEIKLGLYCPFIADVPITSSAAPFPVEETETRSESEIIALKQKLKPMIMAKHFDPPLPLADFCVIAEDRWEGDTSEASECSLGLCLIF